MKYHLGLRDIDPSCYHGISWSDRYQTTKIALDGILNMIEQVKNIPEEKITCDRGVSILLLHLSKLIDAVESGEEAQIVKYWRISLNYPHFENFIHEKCPQIEDLLRGLGFDRSDSYWEWRIWEGKNIPRKKKCQQLLSDIVFRLKQAYKENESDLVEKKISRAENRDVLNYRIHSFESTGRESNGDNHHNDDHRHPFDLNDGIPNSQIHHRADEVGLNSFESVAPLAPLTFQQVR